MCVGSDYFWRNVAPLDFLHTIVAKITCWHEGKLDWFWLDFFVYFLHLRKKVKAQRLERNSEHKWKTDYLWAILQLARRLPRHQSANWLKGFPTGNGSHWRAIWWLVLEPNKALACKCITGKILITENGVFENELDNYANNEILNDKLRLRFSCIWGGRPVMVIRP